MIRRPPFFLIAILSWLVIEFAAFSLVAHFIGLSGALLLGLASTLAGIGMLRSVGRGAGRHVKAIFEGKEMPHDRMLDGALTAFGAILLILPGFVSDMIGLILAAPSGRQFLARRFGGASRALSPKRAGVIDLSPDDWAYAETKKPGEDRAVKRIRTAKIKTKSAGSL